MMTNFRQIKNDIIYILIRALIFILENLPRQAALRIAGMMGEIAAMIDVKERKLAEENLRRVYGNQWSDTRIRLVARECFVKMALNAADVIQSRNWTPDDLKKIIDVNGMEHFDRAFARNRGMVAITGHIGNFELMAAWFAAVKKIPLSVIGRKLYDDRLDELVVQSRQRFGMQNIPSDASAKIVFSALKQGRVLGVLIDLDSSKIAGEFVPFFGIPARTASGPIVLGRKTASPVVPMAMFRTGDDRFRIEILSSFDIPQTGDREADILEALGKCNRALEELINLDPTQWIWIHDRWKSKPSEADGVEDKPEEVELSAG
jgi:KDO2-lipid IV(A) lauroyltransferase